MSGVESAPALTLDQVRAWLSAHPEEHRTLLEEGSTNRAGSAPPLKREARLPLAARGRTRSSSATLHPDTFLAISKNIYASLDLGSIIRSVLHTAVDIIHAERCSVLLVDEERGVLYSKVWDVGVVSPGPTTTTGDAPGMEEGGFSMPLGTGIAGYVATTGEEVNLPDAYQDPRFNPEMDRKTGVHTKSILCLPIFALGSRQVLGVATLINHISSATGGESPFTDAHVQLFRDFLALVGIAVSNSILFEKTKRAEERATQLARTNQEMRAVAEREARKNQALLDLARTLFMEDDISELGRKIISAARDLIHADKASVFIVERDKGCMYSAVFDTGTAQKIVVPLSKGIAGHVATHGMEQNITDAYQDPRFNPEMDKQTGYRTKSLLCVPVFGPTNEVVGVANLINKLASAGEEQRESLTFSDEDVMLLKQFAVYCGLALHKNILLDTINTQKGKLSVAMELMAFHSLARAEDVEAFHTFTHAGIVPLEDIRRFQFDPHQFDNGDQRLAFLAREIFVDLGFTQQYHIPDQKLVSYILTVRRNYRPVAYHNFTHAMSVVHALYSFIRAGIFENVLPRTDLFAMIVATLNHDIDHRGTNNAFQRNAKTPLAAFYSTSVMERHHINHATSILNNINIFESLPVEEYKRALKCMESSILATDLALFFGKKSKLMEIGRDKSFDKQNPEHLELLRAITMTCCDLAAMYKPWQSCLDTADQVYEEFFQQGEEEARMGLPLSAELMDRKKLPEIPRMQVDFYNFIVIPAFEAFHGLVGDKSLPWLAAVKRNMESWKRLRDSGIPYRYGLRLEEPVTVVAS